MTTTTPTLPDGIASQNKSSPEQHLKAQDSTDSKPETTNKPPPFFRSLVRHDHSDWILFACSLCSGLIDSSMFLAYSTFVSMQTGNTIFLTLAVSVPDPKPDAWTRPMLAVALFCIGAVCFSRIYIYLGSPRRRIALIANFALQCIFVILAAALIQANVVGGQVPATLANGTDPLALVPIGLLAFQSASQIVTSRALEMGEVPTVVVTSLLCDLFSDPRILVGFGKNVKRNRRVVGFLCTFLGGVIGGFMGRRTGSVAAALFLAAAVKGCVVCAWFVWPADRKAMVKDKGTV